MMNPFVKYINYLNSAESDTIGALAEYQALSPYYEKMHVQRRLGQYIEKSIRNGEPRTFILTGHAGDGKTSILLQVLRRLGLQSDGRSLQQQETLSNGDINLFYVKDMSEIKKEYQVSLLRKALSAPSEGKFSILVSNTGPLLSAFTVLEAERIGVSVDMLPEENGNNVHTILLNQLDENKNQLISLVGYSFELINIARIDNVNFSKQVLSKIIDPSLWKDCDKCHQKMYCPINHNISQLQIDFNRISSFVLSFYRFLYEKDKRLTTRQMLSHLSYAITGNLSCISDFSKYKDPLFRYDFANLFFGYVGLYENHKATQIKAIKQIKELHLESITLDVDYSLFVKEDYSSFGDTIRNLVKKECSRHYNTYFAFDSTENGGLADSRKENILLRKAVRRFYMMHSIQDSLDNLFNQLYGEIFMTYTQLIECSATLSQMKAIQDLVYKALYVKNTGFLPKNNCPLPLTLRREDNVFQNVMLILGTVNKVKIRLVQKSSASEYDDNTNRNVLFLQFNDNQESLFTLSLPLLSYFYDISKGTIMSNCNPALTHGLAKLSSMIVESCSFESPDAIRVLVNTTSGQEKYLIQFTENKMFVESEA